MTLMVFEPDALDVLTSIEGDAFAEQKGAGPPGVEPPDRGGRNLRDEGARDPCTLDYALRVWQRAWARHTGHGSNCILAEFPLGDLHFPVDVVTGGAGRSCFLRGVDGAMRYVVLCTGEIVTLEALSPGDRELAGRAGKAGVRPWREMIAETKPAIASAVRRDRRLRIADPDAFERLVAVEGERYRENDLGSWGFPAFLAVWHKMQAEIDRETRLGRIVPGSRQYRRFQRVALAHSGSSAIYGFWGWNRYIVTHDGEVHIHRDFVGSEWGVELARAVGLREWWEAHDAERAALEQVTDPEAEARQEAVDAAEDEAARGELAGQDGGEEGGPARESTSPPGSAPEP
jgi:hypothetical protein